ncbi:hypothetical protein [Desulfitobacterium hafniense]|uniref:hypothetical protein n=1 Tax=Desulfitobacterium hafniense TaxID=49338 RepID=UPI00035D1F44|nr:hypothetical protein [Desulfitobacterium hafniense]
MRLRGTLVISIAFLIVLASLYYPSKLNTANAMVKGNTLTYVSPKTDKLITVFTELNIGKILGSFKDESKLLIAAGERTFNNESYSESNWDIYIVDPNTKYKELIYQEAKNAQLSPNEKFIAIVDKEDNLHVFNVEDNSTRLISAKIHSGVSTPKYWSPSGEKIAFMILENDVASGIYTFDLSNNTLKKISTDEEDVKYHSFFITWENETSLIVVESPLERPEDLKLTGYEENGSRHHLMNLSVEKGSVIDDISHNYILIRSSLDGAIELYDRTNYKKINDIKGPVDDEQVFRLANIVGESERIFIKEYKYIDGIKTTNKTSVFDISKSNEEVISNDIIDLGE